jgi:hypothetical protein
MLSVQVPDLQNKTSCHCLANPGIISSCVKYKWNCTCKIFIDHSSGIYRLILSHYFDCHESKTRYIMNRKIAPRLRSCVSRETELHVQFNETSSLIRVMYVTLEQEQYINYNLHAVSGVIITEIPSVK